MDIAWCLVGDEPVMLDITADRYLKPAHGLAEALVDIARSPPRSDEAVDRLLAESHRSTGRATKIARHPCRHPRPSPDRFPRGGRGPALTALPRALIWIARAQWSLRRRGLAALLEVTSERRFRSPALQPQTVEAVLAAHRWTQRLFLSRDACLTRASALAAHLRDLGQAADLVIGVQLRPFTAHCWVEQNGCLLGEDIDYVRCFQPILVR